MNTSPASLTSEQFLETVRTAFGRARISQHEFARRVNYTPGYISKLLNGSLVPPPERWSLFLEALDVAPRLAQWNDDTDTSDLTDLYTTPIAPDQIATILANVLQTALLSDRRDTPTTLAVIRTCVHFANLVSPLIATTSVSLDPRFYRVFAQTLYERDAVDVERVKTFLTRAHIALRPHIQHKWTSAQRLSLSRQIVWHIRLVYAALAEKYGLEISYNDGVASLATPPD